MKTYPLTLISKIGLALAVGLPATAPALADIEPCRTVVRNQLNKLGITAPEVKKISVIEVQGNREFGTPSEWQVWVKLQSCSGNVVIRMTPHCHFKNAYTRGDCRLDNIAHY